MTRIKEALSQLATKLNELEVRWAVIGGLAVSARSEPRTTRDVDVAVAVKTDAEAEHLVRELVAAGYRIREEGLVEQEALDRIATVRLESPVKSEGLGVVVDLMFSSSAIEDVLVTDSSNLEVLEGVTLPVASTGHLIALKILAGRRQDILDVERLIDFATPQDIEIAKLAVCLIEDRQAHRGKDLLSILEKELSRLK